MPTLAIVFIVFYLLGAPFLLWGVAYAHKKFTIDRKLKNPKKKVDPNSLPAPIWGRWKERIKFTFKDSRPAFKGSGPKNSMVFLALWIIGLVLAVAAGFAKIYVLLPVSILIFFVAMGFAIATAKSVIETRKAVLEKIFAIAQLKGLVDSNRSPGEVVHVLKWDNYVDPVEVKFDIATKFSDTGEDGFMQHFNQYFGTELTWVPNFDQETGATGWDYKNSVVTIHTVPPLPTRAPWEARYIEDPGIAWSFFPLGLGVENGVEIPNPETGVVENVLGFDVAGNEAKVGSEAGYKVSPKIVTSPMAMVAGATGGGKAEASDTIVMVVVED